MNFKQPAQCPGDPHGIHNMSATNHTEENKVPASQELQPNQEPAAEVVSDPAARIADLEAKNAELADSYLRARAEAENARRRADEEVAKARKFAVEGFAESMLPVRDGLEAAIATHASGQGSPEQVLEGVHATLRLLGAALERNKVGEINPPAGTRFDPHQHQAISMVPAAQEANTVVAVLQKGYLIADRVLRPALVTVAAPNN